MPHIPDGYAAGANQHLASKTFELMPRVCKEACADNALKS